METLTCALLDAVSKLNEDQKEEIDIIESIININETNKESTTEKVLEFLQNHIADKRLTFIYHVIDTAALIRPKERENIMFLIIAVCHNFDANYERVEPSCSLNIKQMLEAKGFISRRRNWTDDHVFDYAEEGTIERVLFEDDVDTLQRLLAFENDATKIYSIRDFFPVLYTVFQKIKVRRVDVAALFGSVKCFKYLMLNGDEIDGGICKFAISGGNNEIVHLCEQHGLQFVDCLSFSVQYHRFELYEWLNTHFEYKDIILDGFLCHINEPLFYFTINNRSDIKLFKNEEKELIERASYCGYLEVCKFLYEKCNANIDAIFGNISMQNAAKNDNLGIVRYLYETCHLGVEAKDYDECTPINTASSAGNLEVVKYLYEVCGASIEIKDKEGRDPLCNASRNGHLETVRYLVEKCNANIETKDKKGRNPLSNATENGHLSVVKYLVETCHSSIQLRSIKDIYSEEVKEYLKSYKLEHCLYIYNKLSLGH